MAALLLLTIAAMAMGTLTSLFALEVRRTRAERQSAQVRQLLLAGSIIAQQQLTAVPTAQAIALTPPLPPALTSNSGSLAIAIHPLPQADRCQALVAVQLAGRATRQEVELARQAGVWRVVDVRMLATGSPALTAGPVPGTPSLPAER